MPFQIGNTVRIRGTKDIGVITGVSHENFIVDVNYPEKLEDCWEGIFSTASLEFLESRPPDDYIQK